MHGPSDVTLNTNPIRTCLTMHSEVNRTTDEFMNLGLAELLLLAQQERWFHSMKLSTLTTRSWVYGSGLPPNYHLYPTIDILNNLNLEGLR